VILILASWLPGPLRIAPVATGAGALQKIRF
jgi:hypothetical protein